MVNATGGSGLASREVLAAQGTGEGDDALELRCQSDVHHGLCSKASAWICSKEKKSLLLLQSRSFSSQLLKNTSGLVLSHSWLRDFSLRWARLQSIFIFIWHFHLTSL